MTRRDVFIDKDVFMNLLMFLPSWDGKLPQPCICKPKPLWTGNYTFNTLFSSDLTILSYFATKVNPIYQKPSDSIIGNHTLCSAQVSSCSL